MSNSGWEVVGKKGKQQNSKAKKNAGDSHVKKVKELQSGIEESETIFKVFLEEERRQEQLQKKQEQPKPQKKVVTEEKKVTGKENVSKKKKKSGGHQNVDNQKATSQSLEVVIKDVKAIDLATILEEVKTRFPDNPSIWLKDLAFYLNHKLVCELPDPLFSGKPINYPMCLLPNDVVKHFSKLFNECTKPTLQLFQEHCFQEIINHNSRNSPAVGYRLILQCLGHTQPEITLSNIQSLIILRDSYQNRPPICHSILWGAFQAGYKNLSNGLKIWFELILPIIGMKAYSKYAIETLEILLREHQDSKKKTEDVLGIREFFSILDFAFTANALPTNLQTRFQTLYHQLKTLAFGRNQSQNLKNFFPSFLMRLNPQISENLKEELLSNLVYCLTNDVECFSVWRQLYAKHLLQSSFLLEHLLININALSSRFSAKVCKDTLLAFQITNNQVASVTTKLEAGAIDCREYCEELLCKMNRRRFPWSKMLSLLFLITTCLIAYDFHLHGSYEKSVTGKYLKDSGVQAAAEKGWTRVVFYSKKTDKYLRQNIPVYYDAVQKYTGPYLQILYDQLKVAFDFIWEATSDLRLWINKNSPFVIEKVKSYSKICISYAEHILSLIYFYAMELLTFAQHQLRVYLPIIINNVNAVWIWLLENVFVGVLSPQNIRDVILEGLEKTQFYFSQAFEWISNQISALVK